DEVTRSEMQTLLLQITTRHHTSAILVTHDIDEALILADRILLIGGQPGRLIGQWQPDRPHPRDETDPHLTTLRVDILQALRAARTSKLAS
ncbi:MAG TPA: ABC transporter ATP-binding protein, partial [Castellaniella sp.]|nr:ABC transporter ATP-binding protein [Castellaniella sp.]